MPNRETQEFVLLSIGRQDKKMAHFAKINADNIVEEVLVVPDEQEHRGEEYLNELGIEGTWIQTSYNANIRKRFAGIGYEYLENEDAFRSSSPFPSWVWNSEVWEWEAPTPKPEDENNYSWNEELQQWEVKQ